MSVTYATKHYVTTGPTTTVYSDILISNSWTTNIITMDNTSQHNSSLYDQHDVTVSPELLKCTMTSTFKTVTMVATLCTIAVSFFGNSLILISLRKFRKQFKGSLYMFLGNLAISDIFLATGMSLHILEVLCPTLIVSGNMWYCFLKLSITVTSYTESGITLMFMSLDRFCAIGYPMLHFLRHRQRRRIWCAITCTWIISLLCGFLPTLLLYIENMKLHNFHVCRYGECIPKESTLGVVVFLLLQILFNSVLCGLVIWKMKANSKSAPRNKQITMKSKTKLLIKVYILFALCWLPFIVLSIALELQLDLEKRLKLLCTREYMLHLGMLNSGLNWMLYGLTNVKFRKAFKLVLSCNIQQETSNSIVIL